MRRCGAKIEAVATDMSPAYIDAVTTHLPDATLVFDRFHVIKLYNEKLSDLRRELYRATQGRLCRKTCSKGSRWLLLKRPENLDAYAQRARSVLEEALRLNAPLGHGLLPQGRTERVLGTGRPGGSRGVPAWTGFACAESTGIRMLHQFAKTLRFHARGILAYYDYPISTGPLEGTNNKIKTMKRQAYGFRDHEFFSLKILGIHETRYALVG